MRLFIYSPIFMVIALFAVTSAAAQSATANATERVFVINCNVTDLGDFSKLVKSAGQLKPFGRVQINIGTLAERGAYELPKTRSPWYDYASHNSTPYKFFPHAKLAPFVPVSFVSRNKQLLLAKAKILRDQGMEAAFFGSEPNMLPLAFFEAYPAMLGPRVDHPRRSNHHAFAPCIDREETQEMYSEMITDMLRHAPEIKTFYFKTNDAGTGICWGDWLYTGANGPAHCKGRSMGQRVLTLMNSFRHGAEKAENKLDIYLSEGSSNFSDQEHKAIQANLPRDCFFTSTATNQLISVSGIFPSYPITGIIDPVSLIGSLQSVEPGKRQTIFITFRSWYSKGNESVAGMDLSLAMMADVLRKHGKGETSSDNNLREVSRLWAGDGADSLYDAFVKMHEAFQFKQHLGNILPINWNVAARLVNRPLVAAPQRLTKEEESYFLPFVFNVSEQAARFDYTDIQGARRHTPTDSVKIYVRKIMDVCTALERIEKDAPRFQAIQNLSLALRIDASFARSCGNFSAAQVIRDRNEAKLNGPVHRPDKIPTWTGDADLTSFNEVMRDELDNTQELIDVLSRGGLRLICRAKTPLDEDSFLLGPDLMAQLKKKRRVMLDHWRDIEEYMTTPFK